MVPVKTSDALERVKEEPRRLSKINTLKNVIAWLATA